MHADSQLAALACSVLFLVGTAYSLVSAIGFAAFNRLELAEQGASPKRIYERTNRALAEREGRLSSIGPVRSSREVRALLAVRQQHPRWRSTKGCVDVTAKRSRLFCREYGAFQAELARSIEAERLRGEIFKARRRLNDLEGQLVGSSGEQQVSVVAKVLNLPMDKVELGLTLLMAVLVEIGSGLGLFVALHSGQGRKEEREETGLVGDFALASVERAESGRVSMGDLYDAYRKWCRNSRLACVERSGFVSEVVALMDEVGVDVVEEGGQTWIAGVSVQTT